MNLKKKLKKFMELLVSIFWTGEFFGAQEFSVVTWNDLDLEEALVELNIEPTKKNIKILREYASRNHALEERMVQAGWDLIFDEVSSHRAEFE